MSVVSVSNRVSGDGLAQTAFNSKKTHDDNTRCSFANKIVVETDFLLLISWRFLGADATVTLASFEDLDLMGMAMGEPASPTDRSSSP